jgi:hypothetical protein
MPEQEQNGNDEPQAGAAALTNICRFAVQPKVEKNEFLSPIDGLVSRF